MTAHSPQESPQRLAPAGNVQDDTVAADVVLNTDVEVVSKSVEDATRPFGGEVIESADLHTSVRQTVVIVPVVNTRPEIVVAADIRAVTVFVDEPVSSAGLIGQVVHHCQVRCA